jgi:hypothetical protein
MSVPPRRRAEPSRPARRTRVAALTALVAVASLGAGARPASAAPVDPTPRVLPQFGDGEVRATAQIGNRVYVAGSFRRVGPLRTGSAGVANAVTGAFEAGFPAVDGMVSAVVADGAGGWYLGGDFDLVGGLYRQNLAHVLADGSVDAWKPKPDGPVHALAVAPEGDALFVGGAFPTIRAAAVPNLAKVSTATGDLLAWSAGADGAVRTLLVEGSSLWVGGAFGTVGGAAHPRLARLDRTTGEVDPSAAPGATDGEVRALVRGPDGTLYVGGSFTTLGGAARSRLGALSATGTTVLALNGGVDGTVGALALSPSGTSLYVGGTFTRIRGATRYNLAGLALPNGTPTALSLNLEAGPVDVLLAAPNGITLYVGGTFDIRTGAPPNPIRIMALDLRTNAFLPFNPALFEPAADRVGVRAMALVDDRLFLGGDFGAYDGVERPYLVAIDLTTRAVDPTFDPRPNKPVHALLPSADGTKLYIGGLFTTVAGKGRQRLARVDAATGLPDTFHPKVDAEVTKLALAGESLFAGGRFTTVGGQPRTHLARIDVATGALRPMDLKVNGAVRSLDVTPDGATLFITGQFTSVGGVTRNGVASVSVATGRVTTWAPNLYAGRVMTRDLEVSPDGAAVYVVSSGGDNPPAGDTAVKFPTAGSGNVAPLWVNRVMDTMEAVAVADDAVYIGGHLRWVDAGTKPRTRLAALDPATGTGLDWDPRASGFRGVLDLTLAPAGLLVGSDGTHVGHRTPSARFGLLPLVAA